MSDEASQNQASGAPHEYEGTRAAQKQVPKRADTAGKPVDKPRLAQEERPSEEGAGPGGTAGKVAGKVAKSALKKWAYIALGGTTLIGGGATYFTFFS